MHSFYKGPYGAYLAVLNFMKEMEKILLTVGRNSEHYRFHKQVVETLQEIRYFLHNLKLFDFHFINKGWLNFH